MTRDDLAGFEADLDAALDRFSRDIKLAIVAQTVVVLLAFVVLLHFGR
jgi:hypothetical protein